MVRSSMKPRLGGRRTPDSVSGPLVSLSAALMIRFIPIMKRATDILHFIKPKKIGQSLDFRFNHAFKKKTETISKPK